MSIILKCNECGHLYPAHEEPGSCMVAGCDCKLGPIAVLLDCIAALEAENAELRAALAAALDSMVNQKPLGTREQVLKQVRALLAQEPA